jgi:hypothetical protein
MNSEEEEDVDDDLLISLPVMSSLALQKKKSVFKPDLKNFKIENNAIKEIDN